MIKTALVNGGQNTVEEINEIATVTRNSLLKNPWLQLLMGVICMASIANLQYGWTLFVNPIALKHHWAISAIQMAFPIFVLTETWLVPVEGWLVDKFGPGKVVFFGGLLCAISWALMSVADSLPVLYLAAFIGGIGAGSVYGACVGNALKWFPGRRGLAAGVTAAGFGVGAALTVLPIANMIKDSGYEHTFLFFGILQGALVMLMALGMREYMGAKTSEVAKFSRTQSAKDFTPKEMLKSPLFYVMYAIFVLMAVGGLVATASAGPMAKDWLLNGTNATLFGLTLPTLQFALTVDRVLNGFTRPLSGWISDYLGRENTMFVMFGLEAIGIVLLSMYGHNPVAFVVLTGCVFLAWGELFSLMPATCVDAFGSKFAATNANLLYTAKGTASLFLGGATFLVAYTGGWTVVLYIMAGMAGLASIMSMFVLKPVLRKHIASTKA